MVGRWVAAVVLLCSAAPAQARSDALYATTSENLPDGGRKMRAKNISTHDLRCRFVAASGQTFEIHRLPPGATVWQKIGAGARGRWTCWKLD